MIRKRSFLYSSMLLAVFMTVPSAWAADPDPAAVDKLQKVESALGQQENRATELTVKQKEAAADLEDLRQKLIAATGALQQKENEQDHLEDQLNDIEHDVKAKSAELAKTRGQLSILTTALLRLSRQPPALLLLPTALTDSQINRAILLRALLPRLLAQTEMAARDLKTLDDLREKAAEQKRLVTAARQNLESQRRSLDQLIGVRQGLLQRTEAEKQAIAKKLVSLTNEAKDLRDLMAKVAPGKRSQTGLVLPPSLTWPVAGPLVRGFGAKDNDGVTSQGLTFSAPPGSPVVAPAAGRIVFAGPFRGYGQILILQHKGGYHSFLAGFGRIDAEMGQDVAAGEPLGALPAGDRRPELYFEWRRNGEAVNPMEGHARRASNNSTAP